jgi:hypothetical protein
MSVMFLVYIFQWFTIVIVEDLFLVYIFQWFTIVIVEDNFFG